MFTGIVTATGTLMSVTDKGDRILRIGADWDCTTLDIGASVAHSGICLTVLSRDAKGYEVAASGETMRVTTLGSWQPIAMCRPGSMHVQSTNLISLVYMILLKY